MSTPASLRSVESGLHDQTVKCIKALAMDAVQQANSGHPGMPMGSAEMASVLWTRALKHDPKAPQWPDRDRFVLSAGHGSMLLYALLHLTGYKLSLNDIKDFRQWGSQTPGHPEFGHTEGVELTTGPLGTGFSSGVGMAIAERFLGTRYNRGGHTVVDHRTFGICSDGDLMEGIAAEAASLAGHLGLGKLCYLYDDNEISIDGSTDLTFTENVGARFEAYGWHVQKVDGHDGAAIAKAIEAANAETEKPSLIACRTVIGHGSPNLAGTSKTHGAPLGPDEIKATKAAMGWPDEAFHVPDSLRTGHAALGEELSAVRKDWEARFAAYETAFPELAAEFNALQSGEVSEAVLNAIPEFEPGSAAIATRKAGNKILAAVSEVLPTLLGGSADLAGSNGVALPNEKAQSAANPDGRTLYFGVREHAMSAICNGLAVHGGVRPFCATFLTFSDFMRGGVRLSALMKLPVVYIFSHDSFFVGEDGPTHQPIEHAMGLRIIPDLNVVRPADARETSAAWRMALQRKIGDGPTAILLTRQNVPTLEHSRSDISQGAYVVDDTSATPASDLHGIIVATGSEVAVALDAAKQLRSEGKTVRVVSMPCWEAFEAQDSAYRESVLPASVTRRLSVEAGTTMGWARYASAHVGLDHYGASAPAGRLATEFGFTPENVAAKFRALA